MHRIQHENMDTVARNSKFRGAYSTKCDGGMQRISVGDDFLSWCPFARKYKQTHKLSVFSIYNDARHKLWCDVSLQDYAKRELG
jgi:hypothetical protein